MIVYNVMRRFFAMKTDAEAHRKALGLKPDATIALRIESREELAALLNGLCEPGTSGAPDVAAVLPAIVVDRAYVEPGFDIPLFLRKENARRFGQPEPVV